MMPIAAPSWPAGREGLEGHVEVAGTIGYDGHSTEL
jgi:hypothetical protein